ncbi:PucR family transcriptional regulator [Gordonia oryzae]|uniref:PucR family transcriptional regulator n=1 Tax=Gordonia oryzae TaxID=2487349 RepID=A0A3N4GDG9_9ACTN|nr:helix-turn-helix domain-containing protein [Gordonia oryzae]RPA59407.1 PucR family transcriptional regulator [Gordonia oryzae]
MHDVQMDVEWPQVSARTKELIRTGAQLILDPPEPWLEQLHEASLSGARMRAVAEDPVLAAGTRRTNWANTSRWALHNIDSPGERVPAQLTPEIMLATHDLVRRGLDEASLDAFRTAQSVAWRLWMEICFDLTTDPTELRELLDVTSLSISTFIDDTVTAMSEQMRAEREELTRGTHARRREAVTLVLEGAPIPSARAEAQLGYRLAGPHISVVLWSAKPDAAPDLEAAADILARSAEATTRLTVTASATSWWLWLPADGLGAPDLSPLPDVRVSIGRPGTDVDGFRSSHFQAMTTQRRHARLGATRQVVHYDDIRLVSLLTSDTSAGDDFVTDTLGDLADADADLKDTLRTWIRLQCNTSRTAEVLYTHRNTVIRRLDRADDLLPRPLADTVVDVAAALEVLRWRE